MKRNTKSKQYAAHVEGICAAFAAAIRANHQAKRATRAKKAKKEAGK